MSIEPTAIISDGYLGCGDLITALITDGYICNFIIVDLPCRRVITNVEALQNLSLIAPIIYSTDLSELTDTTDIVELLNESSIEVLSDHTDVIELIVRGETFVVKLDNLSLIEEQLNSTNLEEAINATLLTELTDETDIIKLINTTLLNCKGE